MGFFHLPASGSLSYSYAAYWKGDPSEYDHEVKHPLPKNNHIAAGKARKMVYL